MAGSEVIISGLSCFFFSKKQKRRPQASVTFAVIQCDFQSPQFPGLVASAPQIASIPRVERNLAILEEDISDVLSKWIFSPWWEHRGTWDKANRWHLMWVNSLFSSDDLSLVLWTSYKSIGIICLTFTHLRTTFFPHTANVWISGLLVHSGLLLVKHFY